MSIRLSYYSIITINCLVYYDVCRISRATKLTSQIVKILKILQNFKNKFMFFSFKNSPFEINFF